MSPIRLPAVLLAAILVPIPLAFAAPLMGPALSASIAGAEFRGYSSSYKGFENHIWRFLPDGRVTAVYNIRFDLAPFQNQVDGSGSGSWAIEGDRLCIRWEVGMRRPGGCYSIDVQRGYYVRLVGPEIWEGTLQR
jgi:hypothetical protein